MNGVMYGDVVLSAGANIFSHGIKWATRGRGEPETVFSHAGIAVNGSRFIESRLTVRLSYLDALRGYYEVWRLEALTEGQRASIASKAMDYYGRRYGVCKIMTSAMDALLTKTLGRDVFFFRQMNHDDTWPICSWVVAFSYFRALPGFTFLVAPRFCTPDDIHDYILANADEWRLVACGK